MAKKSSFNVKELSLARIGLGTAGLGENTAEAVSNALQNGYTLIDAALLYGNQEAVGEGIRLSGVSRDKFQVTTKVGFFPPDSEGVWMYNSNNVKGEETKSIDLCLKQLGLEYVDLLLIHNPVVSVPEYKAASSPHFFELLGQNNSPDAIRPEKFAGSEPIRPLVINGLLQKAEKEGLSKKSSLEMRKRSWALLEKAHKEGKAKMIGVSNYPAELLEEMKDYAEIMPVVNQIEYHPRFTSPSTYAKCKEMGILIQAYGMFHSTLWGNERVTDAIANVSKQTGRSSVQTIIRWAAQNNVCPILRSKSKENQAANLAALDGPDLTAEHMSLLDSLDENYPYYWLPEATMQTV